MLIKTSMMYRYSHAVDIVLLFFDEYKTCVFQGVGHKFIDLMVFFAAIDFPADNFLCQQTSGNFWTNTFDPKGKVQVEASKPTSYFCEPQKMGPKVENR